MHLRAIILFVLLCLLPLSGYAQRKKKQSQSQSTTVQPYYPSASYEPKAPKRKKRKSTGPTYNARDEFYDRVDKLEKERNKSERMAEKPQYGNKRYFGHKRPPRKRPPSKMRYCRVCGIRH